MTKILKKSLACLLVFVLCFTAIAGCLSVSAAAPVADFDYKTYFPNDAKVWAACAGQNVRAQLSMTDLEAGATIGLTVDIPKGAEITSIDGWNWGTNCELDEVSRYFDEENSIFTIIYDVIVGGNYILFVRYDITEEVEKKVHYLDVKFEAAFASDDEIKQKTVTDYYEVFEHRVVTDEAVAPGCETTGLTEGSHCEICGKVFVAQEEVEATGHNYVDGTCANCGNPDPDAPTCDHADAVATVKTQPTKDAEGVMTYTCACGETWEESIAIPEVSTVYTKLTVNIESVVGTVIDVSYKQVKSSYGEDATYFISIDHEKFSTESATAFMKGNTNTTLPMSNTSTDITANLHKHIFAGLALYEMTLEFNPVVYFVNGDGVVIAYKDLGATSIANIVKAEADGGKATTTLLKLYADMCNYGTALQEYFTAKYGNADIKDQVLPTDVFADYMSNASDPATMPETSFYNTTRNANQKVVSTTGFVSASPVMNVSASNEIKYTVRYDNYDWSDVEIVVSYADSIYGDKNILVEQEEVVLNGYTSQGMPKYDYFFKALPIYDYNQTVTMNMYYKGDLECYTEYSLGYYIVNYLSDANMQDILTTMVLFAESTRDSLNIQD